MKHLAIVTGASAGLGLGFAEGLAARGHSLLLVARRADRLAELAVRLRARHGVAVDTLAVDLAEPGGVDSVIAAVGDLPVDVLVNNAGAGVRGPFATADRARQLAIVRLNCLALVELTHAVLPGMVARRSGGILNIASTAAFQPGPWLAVYYASKAFVLSFSEALHEEVLRQGVRVAALCPGPTRTEFADLAGMGDSPLFDRFASDPANVVRDGLAALDANTAVKVSGAVNAALAASTRAIPRGLLRKITGALQKGRGG